MVWENSVVKKVKRIRAADGGAEAGEVTSGQTGSHKYDFLCHDFSRLGHVPGPLFFLRCRTTSLLLKLKIVMRLTDIQRGGSSSALSVTPY